MDPEEPPRSSVDDMLADDVAPHSAGPWARIRNYFLTGLIVAGPR